MDLFEEHDGFEIIQYMNYRRRQLTVYRVHERINHMLAWDDHEFRVRFRLGKNVVRNLLEHIEDEIASQTIRNNAVTPINKLLLTLRFYATGNFLITTGDFIGVSKTTACLIVRDVSVAIAKLRPIFIRMPKTESEIRDLQLRFYQIARFPRTIGAIDCTYIKIQSPGGPDAEYFRNRDGYYSLKVQTIACPGLKIMNVVARWPGSCHDQTIFNNSRIYNKLISGYWKNSLLVADSKYANTQYVVTPYLNPSNDIEELYNESIIKTRNPVERSYEVLKRRFPVLSFGSRLKLETTHAVIVACCVLHNMACDDNDLEPPELLNMDFPLNEEISFREDHEPEVGNARKQLTEEYFPFLN